MGVEPVPETKAALAELSLSEGRDLVTHFRELTEQARMLVPELVGVSVAALREGLTFTFVASAAQIAVLDALQYLDGGPCVRAAEHNRVVSVEHVNILDEQGWVLFARGSAERGIASTLSLPVTRDGRAIGSVNLYAGHPRAFHGQHLALARLFGAWAGGAVTNADLAFTTRQQAKNAPATLRNQSQVATAAGIIAAQQGVHVDEAGRRLHAAADLAGVPPEAVAGILLDSTPPTHAP